MIFVECNQMIIEDDGSSQSSFPRDQIEESKTERKKERKEERIHS